VSGERTFGEGAKRPRHHPACDTQLGPDFEVEPGKVTMTIFACMGDCWDEFDTTPPAETGDQP
jgi:hypothetical protein